MSSNMLSLCELKLKIKNLECVDEKENHTIYLKSDEYDCYFTIDNVRIDSENDIVLDIVEC